MTHAVRRRAPIFLWLSAGVAGVALGACAGSGERQSRGVSARPTVILVRHAEKEIGPDTGSDPPLTEAGQRRADELAVRLAAEGRLDGVICTQFRRTRETAAPVVEQTGARLLVVEAGRDVETHARAVAAAVDALIAAAPASAAPRFLYVGHSNTIPGVMIALDPRATPPRIAETEYGGLWEVTLPAPVGSPDS